MASESPQSQLVQSKSYASLFGYCAGKRLALNFAEAPRKSAVASSLQSSLVTSVEESADKMHLIPDLVDLHAWNRYCTLLQVFKVFGGIYVQEPDCCPASVAALVQLANNHPGHFPMGFAYGHLSSKAVAVADHTGRGLAAQALLEEFSSQKRLNKNVYRWIRQGVHLNAGEEVYRSWGRRLLLSPGLLTLRNQTLLLRLLADFPMEGRALLAVVDGIGGVQELFLRFFQHYEAMSPFTVFELGWQFNHTRPLMRLLRNRGALAAMSPGAKLELSQWLLDCTHGQLAGRMHHFGRADVHLLAKEAFLCLAESCTRRELSQIIIGWNGYRAVRRCLRGWLHLQGVHYERRLRAVMSHHLQLPEKPSYTFTR